MTVDLAQIRQVQAEADCLISQAKVETHIEQQAALLTADLADLNPLFLLVMNGGFFYAQRLLERLNFPLQMDYLQATRYRGNTTGADLQWLAEPRIELAGRHVVVLDDILDEGHTLLGIREYCLAKAPASLRVAVLLQKIHDRLAEGAVADYPALTVPDRYVFGSGMDYKEYLRQLPGIHAVKGL